jgi:hypothetical protein
VKAHTLSKTKYFAADFHIPDNIVYKAIAFYEACVLTQQLLAVTESLFEIAQYVMNITQAGKVLRLNLTIGFF